MNEYNHQNIIAGKVTNPDGTMRVIFYPDTTLPNFPLFDMKLDGAFYISYLRASNAANNDLEPANIPMDLYYFCHNIAPYIHVGEENTFYMTEDDVDAVYYRTLLNKIEFLGIFSLYDEPINLYTNYMLVKYNGKLLRYNIYA